MGKGGTRFVGEAIGQRSGRQKSTYTNKELRKNMDQYLETGVHPDFEAGSSSSNFYPLPEHDPNRPHVFLELSYRGDTLGKLVVEVFEDVLPGTAATFRHRCSHGSTHCIQGSKIHKIQSAYAVFGGLDAKSKAPAQSVRRSPSLKHVGIGAVSVALDGSDFAISLGRSLKLDETHQVVGRVQLGREILDRLDAIPTSTTDDSPLSHVTVSKCGTCDSKGTHDSFDDAGPSDQKLSEKETAEMLANEAEATKESVRDAVLSGLNKRKAPGPDSSGKAPAKASKGMMGGMMGDLSDSASDDDDDDDDEGS